MGRAGPLVPGAAPLAVEDVPKWRKFGCNLRVKQSYGETMVKHGEILIVLWKPRLKHGETMRNMSVSFVHLWQARQHNGRFLSLPGSQKSGVDDGTLRFQLDG